MWGPSDLAKAMTPPGAAVDTSKFPRDSRGPIVIGVVGLCWGVGTLAVGARLYTRYFLVKKLGIDDYMAMASMAFLFALGGNQIQHTKSGLGKHLYTLDPRNGFEIFARDLWLTVVLYNFALLFVKMTFLFQYYRVVAQVKKLKYVYIASMVIIGGWTLAQCILMIFMCNPVSGFWIRRINSTCLPDYVSGDMNVISNIVTDFIILVLPLPVLLRLSLRPAQKWALIGVFCIGFFTCIISIMRRIEIELTTDVTYSAAAVSSWSIAEVTSGITCAALPILKPLLSRCFPAFRDTSFKRLSPAYYNGKGSVSRSDSTRSGPARFSWGRFSRSRSVRNLPISRPQPLSEMKAVSESQQRGSALSKPSSIPPTPTDVERVLYSPSVYPTDRKTVVSVRPTVPPKDSKFVLKKIPEPLRDTRPSLAWLGATTTAHPYSPSLVSPVSMRRSSGMLSPGMGQMTILRSPSETRLGAPPR